MQLKLIDKKEELGNIKTFVFKPLEKLIWKAGQYGVYKLPHENPDLRGKMRFITIASAPFEKKVFITTRIEKSPSTFKKTLDNLPLGGEIELRRPDGDMYIESEKKTYVFTAGGIGITPFWSILKQLNFEKKKIKIILLYANKNKDFLFKKALEEFAKNNLNFKICYFISPQRIEKQNYLDLKINLKQSFFFTSGPENMIYQIEDLLKSIGVPRTKMRQDYYTGYKKI